MKTKTPWFGYILIGLLIGFVFSVLTSESKPDIKVWPDSKWIEYEECINSADGATDSHCDSCWKAVFGYNNIVHSVDNNWYIWYSDSLFPTQLNIPSETFIETEPETLELSID